MAYITEEILDTVIEKLEAQSEEGLSEMVQNYFGKQPFLMMYIMGFNEELESDDARDELVFLLLVVLECFYSLNKNIRLISAEEIEKEEEEGIALMARIEAMTDEMEKFKAIEDFMPEEETLFLFIGDTLGIEEEMDEEDLDDDESDAIFGGIKLVVEVMTNAINDGGLKAV